MSFKSIILNLFFTKRLISSDRVARMSPFLQIVEIGFFLFYKFNCLFAVFTLCEPCKAALHTRRGLNDLAQTFDFQSFEDQKKNNKRQI